MVLFFIVVELSVWGLKIGSKGKKYCELLARTFSKNLKMKLCLSVWFLILK